MSFWNDDSWKRAEAEKPSPVVEPFDPALIDDAKYKLRVGPEIYISTGIERNTIRRLNEQEAFTLKPGEFAFILTEEYVHIPLDNIGFISMSTKIKFYGLVNVSGFHVDPGYSGRLIFAVFNAGPKTIHLQRGEPIFSLWLAALDGVIMKERKKGHDGIPPEFVNRLEGNFLTAYQLSEKIDELRNRISELEHNWRKIWIYAAIAIGFFFYILRHQILQELGNLLVAAPN